MVDRQFYMCRRWSLISAVMQYELFTRPQQQVQYNKLTSSADRVSSREIYHWYYCCCDVVEIWLHTIADRSTGHEQSRQADSKLWLTGHQFKFEGWNIRKEFQNIPSSRSLLTKKILNNNGRKHRRRCAFFLLTHCKSAASSSPCISYLNSKQHQTVRLETKCLQFLIDTQLWGAKLCYVAASSLNEDDRRLEMCFHPSTGSSQLNSVISYRPCIYVSVCYVT